MKQSQDVSNRNILVKLQPRIYQVQKTIFLAPMVFFFEAIASSLQINLLIKYFSLKIYDVVWKIISVGYNFKLFPISKI